MLATTPFSFINIYLALKTSRNNAVVDLSESKTIEKRIIKESIFKDFFLEIFDYFFGCVADWDERNCFTVVIFGNTINKVIMMWTPERDSALCQLLRIQ